MSLNRYVSRLQSAILDHPRIVLGVSAGLALIAVMLGTQVEFRTSRAELGPSDDPDQARWTAILNDYSGAEAVIACVEAESAETPASEVRDFVDLLAAALGSDPLVEHTFHRVDIDWFLTRGLYLAPPEELRRAIEALDGAEDLVARLASIRGFADLNHVIAERIERGLAESTTAPADGDGAVAGLVGLIAAEARFFENPEPAVDEWTSKPAILTLAGSDVRALTDGYLKTRDESVWFVIVSPRSADDSLETYRGLVSAMDEQADRVVAAHPGFRVAFTGQPAIVVEEMDTVRGDTLRTSVIAVVGVFLLTSLVFRWRSHVVLVLLALAAGLAWSIGAVRLELGYLNLITSSFLSTLVGVGVAYGIHPVSEYELRGAHTVDPLATVRESYHRTGAAVTTAAVTTAAAFFSIQLMRFPGFAELGLVAGVGVLLCLVAALVTLPALLVVYGRWRHRRDRTLREGSMTSVVDRFWIERMAGNVCRAPRRVLGIALLVTAGMGWLATGIGFNTNFFDLLPRDAKSIRYQRVMAEQSDLSPLFNIAPAADLDSLRAMRDRADAEPAIARFESVLRFLPEEPAESERGVADLRSRLESVRLVDATAPIDRDQLAASLSRLETVLADASEAAFGAGLAESAASLETARAEAERARAVVLEASVVSTAGWEEGEARLLLWLDEGLDALHRATTVAAPTLESLPSALRERFFTRSGRPLAFLYPAGDVFDPDELEVFVAASRRVTSEASGFPMVFNNTSRQIVDGFSLAVFTGGLLVLVILYLDFRSVKDALLAIVPLAMGVVWMLGGMRILGISFNFANLVAVPLIIGVGIDNGVHVIQRVRFEGREGMGVVLRHTGRAILIASLTTMIGFGSLAVASHRGMSSLGTVLLLGVGACLVTSTIVLPNLLVLIGYKE